MTGASTDLAAVSQAAATYCEALWVSDVSALQALFHDRACLYGVSDADALEEYTAAEWLEIVGAREGMDGQAEYKVREVTVPTDDLAVAVVDAAVRGREFTDTLSFLKLGGEWRVIAKTFHIKA